MNLNYFGLRPWIIGVLLALTSIHWSPHFSGKSSPVRKNSANTMDFELTPARSDPLLDPVTPKEVALVAEPEPDSMPDATRVGQQREGEIESLAQSLRTADTLEEKGVLADQIAAVGGFQAVEKLYLLAFEQVDELSTRAVLDGFNSLSDPSDILALASSVAATSNFQVLQAAIETVARAATGDTVNYLAELYRQSPSQPTQPFAALWAIESVENPEAARSLGKLIAREEEPDLAAAAAIALSRIGGPLAHSTLADAAALLGPGEGRLRLTLANALSLDRAEIPVP